MNNSLARFQDAGSFIAGILIGLSIMAPVFASLVVNPTDLQMFLVFGAPIILAVGITLQVVITAKPRHQRTINTALGWRAVCVADAEVSGYRRGGDRISAA